MALPAEVVSTEPPSRGARISYRIFANLFAPLVRFYLAAKGDQPMCGRLTLLGRGVNAVSRLQRLRPFRGLSFVKYHEGDVLIEVVRLKSGTAPLSDGAIFYLHGGGFFVGGLNSHLHAVAGLARRTGLPVVHVEYRQHPDVKIDGSIRDCVQAYRWLLNEGADPAKTVFAGDSAGGFLVFATVLAAQQAGLAAPAGVVGISPWLELDSTARAAHENATRDAFGVTAGLPAVVRCVSPVSGADPSPVNGNLESFPPALIVAAESEILRCDAERMQDALIRYGRACTLRVWPRQLHAFPVLLPFLPESRAALRLITDFIRARLAGPGETGQRRAVS